MAVYKRELLNQGLVTSRHGTLLNPGELQQADDVVLRPGDPAVHKAPGRTQFAAASTLSISVTANGSTTLTSVAQFGTSFANTVFRLGDSIVDAATNFGAVAPGQYVRSASLPSGGGYIKRVIGPPGAPTQLELTVQATVAGLQSLLVVGFLQPGTFISGSGVTAGTYITAIASASSLTLSAAVTAGAEPISRIFANDVRGLRACTFDHGFNDILLCKVIDSVRASDLTGSTGSFISLKSGLNQNVESTLETIKTRNKHIYLTGYDRPRILYYRDDGSNITPQLTERELGMQPVPAENFSGPALVTGSWSSLSTMQNGWYYFLVTEVLKNGNDDEVEGTYIGDPKGVEVTSYATQGIQVTYLNAGSQAVNDGLYNRNTATHWRIYMSPKQENEFPLPDLAAFVHVGDDVPIATNSVKLSEANPFVVGFAGSLAANGALDPLFPSSSTNAISQTTAVSKTSVTWSEGSTVLAVSSVTNITAGMYIQTANDRFPFGTKVIYTIGTNIVGLSAAATSASAGETVYFGNKSTFDAVYALCPVNRDSAARSGIFRNFGIQDIGGFNTATVTGVEVIIPAKFASFVKDAGFNVNLSTNNGTTPSPTTYVATFNIHGKTVTLGGQFDMWGLTVTHGQVVDGSLAVILRKNYGANGENLDHYIDGVQVKVYAGTNVINLDGKIFRTVTISDQLGNAFGSGANGPPPTASTGDTFDGQILLNDTSDESVLCASLPDEPEAFPDVYRIPLESGNSKIRNIKRLNNVVIIGCLNSVKRLNYFPRETDPEFRPGQCYEDLATDHGMVGPRCATRFHIPGGGPVLAYVSHSGLRVTDGITTRLLNEDLDWPNLIEPTLIQRTVLECYPKMFLLAMYYVPLGGTRKTKAMYYSYHPTQIKPGNKLPAMGPISVEGCSAATSVVAGTPYLLTGHSSNGIVYLEDSGTAPISGETIVPVIRTRRFYAQTLGMSGELERVHVVADAAGTSTTGGFTAAFNRQNQNEAVQLAADTTTRDTSVGGIIKLFLKNQAETFDITLSKTNAQNVAWRVHYLGLELTGYGPETTG